MKTVNFSKLGYPELKKANSLVIGSKFTYCGTHFEVTGLIGENILVKDNGGGVDSFWCVAFEQHAKSKFIKILK